MVSSFVGRGFLPFTRLNASFISGGVSDTIIGVGILLFTNIYNIVFSISTYLLLDFYFTYNSNKI